MIEPKVQHGKNTLKGLAIFSALGALLVLSFQNCNTAYQPLCGSCSGGAARAADTVSGTLALSQPTLQTANLGTSLRVPVVLTGDNAFTGAVNLSLRASDIQAIDPGNAIAFSLDHTSVNLTPGVAVTVNVLVNISTMAPSFANQSLHIDAYESANTSVKASTVVPLQIKAIYDVSLHGAATASMPSVENWSVSPGQTVSFVSHAEGLTLRFNNYATDVHLIHSSGGPITHESLTIPYPATSIIGLPPSANGTVDGGIYSVMIPPGTSEMTSQVYCHFHEPASQARNFQFNVPSGAVTPTPTPVADANAKFSYVNGIMQTSCVGCHSGSSPPAGINLSSYNGVIAAVTKGNASTSAIFNAVNLPNPAMPRGGAPLTATQVLAIKDWINAGALNN